jgi:hypothetical protein
LSQNGKLGIIGTAPESLFWSSVWLDIQSTSYTNHSPLPEE